MKIDALIQLLSIEEKEKAFYLLTKWHETKHIKSELIPIDVFVARNPEMSTRLKGVLLTAFGDKKILEKEYGYLYINELISEREFLRNRGAGKVLYKELVSFLTKAKLL